MSIPSHWIHTPLQNVATVIDPNPTHRNPKYVPSGFPFVSTAEFVEPDGILLETRRQVDESTVLEQEQRCAFAASSIFFSRKGTIGKTRLHPGVRLALLDSLCVINPSAALEPRFLVHALRSPQILSEIEAVVRGVALPQICVGRVRELTVPIAPLNEQRRIVAKLESLQARSRRAREALDAVPPLLEKLRLSILAAAFRGDLTKEWREKHPNVAPISELLSHIPKPPLPARAKSKSIAVREGDCGLSVGNPGTPTPRGWKWVSLIDVARLESGHTPSRLRPEWWGGEIPWIGIKDARDNHGRTITETRQSTNHDGLANSAARLLPRGTVCLSRTATIGYVTVMGADMATSQDFVNWVCTEAVEPHWLKLLLMAEKRALLSYSSQSTNVATIFYPELLAFHVCLPPPEEQRAIVREVERLMAWATKVEVAHREANERLPVLTRSIFGKAFRGELVPQDPSDESAEALLARLRGNDTPAPTLAKSKPRARRSKAAE